MTREIDRASHPNENPATATNGTNEPTATTRQVRGSGAARYAPVVHEWRCAARSTEPASTLTAMDTALTATGLAAEIAECVERLKALT